MSGGGFSGDGTIGGKAGCVVAAIVGLPLLSLILLFASGGTTACGMTPKCNASIQLLTDLAGAVALLACLGFFVRFVVNWIVYRVRSWMGL